MNKIITTQDRNPASGVAIGQSGSGIAIKPESLGDVVRFAELMCQSKAGIPAYLHGNAADCMAVTMQALQWDFNPFSVAQKSYKIKDVIAYEAQLIAAVINTRADLKRRPQVEYRGVGAKRQCIVTFEFKDGSVQVYESPEFEKITPKNSPLWKSDPDQQQAYYSLRAGARRYCPEVILGAYDREEVEDFRGPDRAKNITPVFDPLSDEPVASQRPADEHQAVGGMFDADEAHDALTGEILNNTPSDDTPSTASSSADAGNTPVDEAGADEVPASDAPASTIFPIDRADLIECCNKLMYVVVSPLLETPQQRRATLVSAKDLWKDKLPEELHLHIKAFVESADAQIKADPKVMPALREKALAHFAEMLDCKASDLGGVDG
ncbi:recombinase RecT [Agrobacterium sp. S2/73]|uniref:recombinase RecT n=1 Tax=unclassified Agrobacterium TaxID=2632611 RepID=UPI001ADB5FA6|nr:MULTISPECIES: recombinase RecT [unclassified Agrobacterium]MBO9108785.1 recombinase RecT [Agrobacterium sp. S2/73]QXZ73458.1 recombinase RecT [Agrobacterium sp. S7/73]